MHDLRIAVRGVTKRPGFALAVILTLGLGIGATTTIFSVVDGVMFRPLPYDDPSELVAVGTTFPGREWADERADLQHLAGTSALNFQDFKRRSRTLVEMSAVEVTSFLMPDEGTGPELVVASAVTPDFFSALRASPAMGRLFLPEEYDFGSESVAVISYSTWINRHGGTVAGVQTLWLQYDGTDVMYNATRSAGSDCFTGGTITNLPALTYNGEWTNLDCAL